LSHAKKAACVAEVTEAFEHATGIDREHLVIHIEEHAYANVGVAGQLLSDTFPELAEKDRAWRADTSDD